MMIAARCARFWQLFIVLEHKTLQFTGKRTVTTKAAKQILTRQRHKNTYTTDEKNSIIKAKRSEADAGKNKA